MALRESGDHTVKRVGFTVAAIVVIGVIGWIAAHRGDAPAVPFARAYRETLVSLLTTNGKVEPAEYAAVRSEVEAPVSRVPAERGQRVTAGAILAQLGTDAAESELAEANAAIAQARADLERFERGGDPAAMAEIENGIRKARLDVDVARREAEALERLVAKNAATRAELEAARDRVRQGEAEIQGLERKRANLLPPGNRAAIEARIQQGLTAAAVAQKRIEQSRVRSPIAGIVYNLPVKPGAFLHPGDLVAEVGKLEKLRAVLYVDEPDLGRVHLGAPVTVRWDGAPEGKWTGKVDRLPTQVAALGTRQVGEVICLIDNPERVLQPGANVDAEIRTAVAEGALTIPKEAVRREGPRTGVLVLQDGLVRWRDVRLGVSSLTRVQVLSGAAEGDAVALPGDRPVRDGDTVNPVFRQ
jgi:HlyD family secretion protein